MLTLAIAIAPADSPNVVVADGTPVRLAADGAGVLLARLPPPDATHRLPPGPLAYRAVAHLVVCRIIHLKFLLSEFLLEKGEVWFTSPKERGEWPVLAYSSTGKIPSIRFFLPSTPS
jgi:hypothetical protein